MYSMTSALTIPLTSIISPQYASQPDFEYLVAQALLEQGDHRPFIVERKDDGSYTGWLHLCPFQPERERSYLEQRWEETYALPEQEESPEYYEELATGQSV